VLRIMPALAVVVLLSAFVIGPLLTTLPLRTYLADPLFHAYLLNLLADIRYRLPGVFVSNPFPDVNSQLWTIPYELICYFALMILAATGIFQRRWWLLLSLMGFYVAQVANTILRAHAQVRSAGGSAMVMSFLAGLVIYRYRDKIPFSARLFLLACVASAAMVFVPNGVRFAALPIAYVTIYLGLQNPQRSKILLSGDYSYGLYLYGFLTQQVLMSISPALRQWYWNLLLAIPSTFVLAVGSWWLVEKPALAQRNRLKQLEEWYLGAPAAWRTTRLKPTAGLTAIQGLISVEETLQGTELRANDAEG